MGQFYTPQMIGGIPPGDDKTTDDFPGNAVRISGKFSSIQNCQAAIKAACQGKTIIQIIITNMDEQRQLEQAIAQLEAQRPLLGDAVVDAAQAPLHKRLAELGASHSRDAPSKQSAPSAGERRQVTILFADISGFTTLSETLDPEMVRDLINACFSRLAPIIEKYDGTIDKFIGDEIMALFGAPIAHENDPERALRAALEMQTALANFGTERDLSLGLHCGINTGLVIAGQIGSQGRQEYTVMGDAVNLASRLTDLSQSGQILVGEQTYQLAAALFDFENMGDIHLKGKHQSQVVYRLLNLKERPEAQRGLSALGLSSPLIGRQQETAILQATLQLLGNGQGGLVLVCGEAGVGKSRLIAETSLTTTFSWHEGHCLSYGETLSYHLFLSLLRNLLEVTSEADSVHLQASLRRWLETLLPQRVSETYPYLADLLGLPLEPDECQRLERLPGESRRWQLFNIFAELITRLPQHSPIVIVLEDLHWADPSSLDLLERLAPLSSQLPLLLILLSRPHQGRFIHLTAPRLRSAAGEHWKEIHLAPLSSDESRQLIEHLLAVEDLTEALHQQILDRAEGNPLFLEEILRTLVSQGILQRSGEHWHMTPGADLEQIYIPPTLQGVIMARLDRLDKETRGVLQMAAVIGRVFWYRILEYVTSIEQHLERMVDQHLTDLEEFELIRQICRQPDLEYAFKHILVQDAAYHTLLREQRRFFHLRVAEALEKVFAGRLEEHYGVLAHHYEVAGESKAARHYLRRAGDRARRAYALPEAQTFYQRALALLPPEEEGDRRQLLLNLGLVSLTQGNFNQAGEYYAAAFQIPLQAGGHTDAFAPGLLRISFGSLHPRSLEPAVTTDMYTQNVLQNLFSGLVEFDQELNLLPNLAERWEVDRSGRRYRFYLRPQARWSDGHVLTAADFVFAWQRTLYPDLQAESAHLLYILRGAADYHQRRATDPQHIGVWAAGDHVLEVELAAPAAYFLPMLASPAFYPLPRHAWPPACDPKEHPENLVVNGPFRLAAWQEASIRMERNPFYGGETSGNVASVEICMVNTQQRILKYLAGELDISRISSFQGQTLYESIPSEQWITHPGLATFYLGLMPHLPPLDDRRVRHALALSVDRPRMAQLGLSLGAVAAYGGFIPAGMPGHSPELSLPYDPQQALDLLRQAGYARPQDLPRLRFYGMSGTEYNAQQFIIQHWQELGVPLDVLYFPGPEHVHQMQVSPPHLFAGGWIADYPDPHSFMAEGFQQRSYWQDTGYWELAALAGRTQDIQQRLGYYHELDRRLVVEEALCIPLTYMQQYFIVQPHIRRYPVSGLGYTPIKDIDVSH